MKEVTSVIKINGEERILDGLRSFVDVNETGFEFEKIIPEPKGLEPTLEDHTITLEQEINRLSYYGATDLNEWRKMYWGTLSPNIRTSWYSNHYLKMVTDETPPLGILRSLTLLFDVELFVLHTSSEECAIIIIKNGSYIELPGTYNEASILNSLIDDPHYNYKKWEKCNTKLSKSKKSDMNLLFHCETEFLKTAKKIIDPKNHEVQTNPTSRI